MNQPLKGLKVIELASVVATPIAARLLSDYGADVIKVEAPSGDLLRSRGESFFMPTADDNNPLFDLCNTGKKLVCINMKTEDGIQLFLKLLKDADIFMTNIRMQSLERMGVDYDSLKDRFPKLIYAHFSGFGLKGEEKNRPGYDSTAFWMRSGAAIDISTPGSFPLRPSFAFGDITTASEFTAAILMAVIGREKTGKGTMVTTSLLQSGIWCSAVSTMNAQPPYNAPYPVDRYHPGNPFADFYECSDGEYMACFQNNYDRDRQKFAELFHLPELNTDPDLASVTSMTESGKIPAVARHMQEEFSQHTSAEWEEILNQYDIPHELGRHFKDAYQDKQANAIGTFDKVPYPGDVTTSIPRPPFEFSSYDRKEFQKSGPIGRDTRKVLKEMGYSEDAIAEMSDEGAIVTD